MKKMFLLVALAATMTSCEGDKDQLSRVLKAEGCTQVTFTGYDAFGCSDSDDYSCGFTAVRNGRPVNGVVCSGILKGVTVRYY